jgi:hypothetical protein
MPRLLELFSGTGSVGRAFQEAGWEVVSVDSDLAADATIHADVQFFDFRWWHPGHFDCVWASPPCTQYSCARTTARAPRDLEAADRVVMAALDAVVYLRPKVWWMENPATGLLKTRPFMQALPPPLLTDYCMWGFPYRKRTCLWTNVSPELARLPLCDKNCNAWAAGRHVCTAQRGPGRFMGDRMVGDSFPLDHLYSLPPPLCRRLAALTQEAIELQAPPPGPPGPEGEPQN